MWELFLMKSKLIVLLVLIVIVHLMLLYRQQFTLWPEIYSFPYLLNSGFKLYSDFVVPYPPLLVLFFSTLFKLVGYNVLVVKVLTYLLVILNDILIYKIVRLIAKNKVAAIFSLIFYISTQPFLDGNMIWFDTVLVTPILFSFYFYKSKRYTRMSVSLVTACLIKQTAGIYLLIFVGYLFFKNRVAFKQLLITSLISLIVLLSYVFISSSMYDFLSWNFTYPFLYWSKFPGYVQFNLTTREYLTLAIFTVPSIYLLLKKKFLLVMFFIGSLVAIYPRFSYFHMQLAIAISAISFGYLVKEKRKTALIFLLIAALYISKPRLSSPVNYSARFFDSGDIALASNISKATGSEKEIFLLGLPSQLYVLTNTIPPKPWLDNYGWYYEMPEQTAKVLNSFKQKPPKFIIRREPANGNWYDLGVYEPKSISDWIFENYERQTKLESNIYIWKIKN